MTISCHYHLEAAVGQSKAMEKALEALRHQLLALPGCHRVDLLRKQDSPTSFLFAETWDSMQKQKLGGAVLGKSAFEAVFAVTAGSPQRNFFDHLSG